MAVFSLFRDTLAIDQNIAAVLAAATPPLAVAPGDTLVLGARQCSIAALPNVYNYVIVADKLTVTAPVFALDGLAGNPSPAVTIIAVEIDGALNVVSQAMPGVAGANGANGANGRRGPGGTWAEPPEEGEPGENGTPGSPGGKAIVHYCRAALPPTAVARGGAGGPGGKGGKGGKGPPNAPDGANGLRGANGPPGQFEAIQVGASQIWNALDSEVEVEWAEFRGASITIWHRLEIRTRAQDIRPGLEARVFDPLWLLARQWQIGEFAGRDAGSPIGVDVTTTTRAFDRYATGTAQAQAYDGSVPLEVLVEREAVRPVRAADDLRQAAEAGLHFGRLLDGAKLTHLRPRYLSQYRMPNPAGAGAFGAVIAGRVIDGIALYTDLLAAGNNLPAVPVIPNQDRPLLLPVVQAWLQWYAFLFSEPPQAPAWSPARMEYSFAIGAAGDTGSLVAHEYDGGTVDWHTFDKSSATLTGGPVQPSTTTRQFLPSPVTFRGMPARRYWELEDGSVDLGALTAGPEDLGRLLLREFALVYATDWFLVPLNVPFGSVTNIDSFKVSDTFGRITVVPHYAAVDGTGGPWRMFAASSGENSPPDYRLLILPAAAAILDSEALEDVLLLRDELADIVWGIERTVLGPAGVPVDRALVWRTMAPPSAPPNPSGMPRYRLGSDVPDYWIPLLPVLVNDGPPNHPATLRFRRGILPTANTPAPLGAFLSPAGLTLYPEEVPREGVRLQRRWRQTRTPDGSTCLWIGRERSTGLGEGRSGLKFDYLES